MEQYTITDLGTLVHLFVKGNRPDTAQIYLNEMQERVTAAKQAPLLKPAVAVVVEPNELLAELPPMIAVAGDSHPGPTKTLAEQAGIELKEEGIIYDAVSNILAISSQSRSGFSATASTLNRPIPPMSRPAP